MACRDCLCSSLPAWWKGQPPPPSPPSVRSFAFFFFVALPLLIRSRHASFTRSLLLRLRTRSFMQSCLRPAKETTERERPYSVLRTSPTT